MSNSILLSICISSFNNGQKCEDLVKKILRMTDDRINIVVCDDCSDELTQSYLQKLRQDRVKVFINSSNLGACPNWYETIEHGDGKYLLHILDRDYIDTDILNELIDRLEHCDAGVGYLGNIFANPRKSIVKGTVELLDAGEGAVAEVAGLPLHPTGFFVSRDEWNREEFKKFFYNEHLYGIYPHSYLMGIIGLRRQVMLIRKSFCRYVYSQSKKSLFYQKKENVGFWWEPESIFGTSKKMLSVLCELFFHESFRNVFVENVFIDGIFRGTVEYRKEMLNKRQMSHYSLKTKNVSLGNLLVINFIYMIKYIQLLRSIRVDNSFICTKILKAAFINGIDIVRNY